MAEPGHLGSRILEAIRSGSAPRPARLAAARGALPLTPAELLDAQLTLASDEDAEVASAAADALSGLPADSALRIAEDPDVGPAVICFLAEHCAEWPAAAASLAARPRTPADAMFSIAASAAPDALAALAINQSALAANAGLGELLAENPALPTAARVRLLDYLDELTKRKTRRAAAAAAAADAASQPARDPFLAALGVDAEVEALLPELGLELGQLRDRSELLGEPVDEDEATLISRLSRLSVGQKLRVALFGARTERMVLIRDTNRVVAAAVLKNPKFSQQEAEAAANSRNVCSEVLRVLARHREFSKAYAVQHSLVCNPRCPPAISMPLIPQLNGHDLKRLVKNRNVTEGVRRQAKKIIAVREARTQVSFTRGRH